MRVVDPDRHPRAERVAELKRMVEEVGAETGWRYSLATNRPERAVVGCLTRRIGFAVAMFAFSLLVIRF